MSIVSVRLSCICICLSSQVKARSTIAGTSAPAVDAQKVFQDTFNDWIKGDLSIDMKKFQGVLQRALSKVDFSIGVGIYMHPSNLNLAIGKTKGYNNKILMGNTSMKIGSNRYIYKDHEKLIPLDVSKTVFSVDRHDPAEIPIPHNLKMLTERHNDEKLTITFLIVGWIVDLLLIIFGRK